MGAGSVSSSWFRDLTRLVACLLAILATSPSSTIQAQELIVAFGDSITAGRLPFDEQNKGGYPGRLETILNDSGLATATVVNAGFGGETTAEGLTRINGTLDAYKDADLFIIMEGTNDVNLINEGLISIGSVVSNLEAMAGKVRSRAIDVLYASVLPRPPWARQDSSNILTFELVFALRELTSSGNRELAEPYEVFENRENTVFSRYYYRTDPVGHPNAAGFDLMAQIFADKILGNDTLAPAVSGFSKNGATETVAVGNDLFAIIHESGEGIRQNSSYFTINGRPVDTEVEGSVRRTLLSYKVTAADIECAGRITVRTEDRAEPENVRNRLVGEYGVQGATLLQGDVNGDCRVDGLDLSLLGRSFGSQEGDTEFSRLADTNGDSQIDGEDLARMARNFGKTSD